jgi:hypothetical protein
MGNSASGAKKCETTPGSAGRGPGDMGEMRSCPLGQCVGTPVFESRVARISFPESVFGMRCAREFLKCTLAFCTVLLCNKTTAIHERSG